MAGLAAVMALSMWCLAALFVGHALLPAQKILEGLRRLEGGDLGSRLPAFRTPEFDKVASAFNDLAGRLQATAAERSALTRRLFQVQEDERRALARDLTTNSASA
ncbi:HAMP domain protein [Methylobrevis pamukkalensis]|uniref:HAMP domain protein n=2 Tax=Methylobrevis pamukkalensis TaxID=1439726 RepID=A0A1E3GXS1_9HYPH|nr:HAMP domain protein [Methylobrevis pamukkalensis]